MNILLVEDSATLRHALCSYIEQAGHTPLVAKSGEEALQLVENDGFDLIIMDVEMPGLDGFETTRLMREWYGDHWVPIIFVTGKTDEESVCAGIEAGGDDYLPKPISQVILSAKIRAMERLVAMRDQMNRLNAELEALSQRDSLTQLYNRRTFAELAGGRWASANRYDRRCSVLMLDVDHFKQFNDRYGHPAGDECLRRVASAVSGCAKRPDDLVARYGGEEFVVLLPETDNDGAVTVGNAIREAVLALAIPHEASATGPVVSISVGAACSDIARPASLDELIGYADKALYRAKQAGRNRVHAQADLPHKTVLIAAGDQDYLQQLSGYLHNRYNIVTTDTARECVDIARSLRPDLILLDFDISGGTGAGVCAQFKADRVTKAIPLVLIASGAQARVASAAGADDLLGPPLGEDQVLEKVVAYLH